MIRITDAWFEFKGKRSDDMGIRLRQMPARGMPAERGKYEELPGRSGALWFSEDGYGTVDVRIECDVPDGHMDSIAAWLTGSGLLRFSDEPNRAYEARIIRSFSRSNPFPRFTLQRFTVVFSCQPFRLLYPAADDIVVTASGTTLDMVGTAPAAPRVAIYGSGDFMVAIGRQAMFFTDISSGVIVDSALMDALTLDGGGLLNNNVSGDFFTLDPGYPTTVSWTLDSGAALSKIIITPRWRYY